MEVHRHSESHGDSRFGPQAVARLRAAFDRSRNAMLIVDDARRWVEGNDAASELLGIPREEISWRTMDEFTPPSERVRLEEQWQLVLSNGAAEGWYQLYVPEQDPVAVEFSVNSNVLPGRHLAVFIPPDETLAEPGENPVPREAAWTPALVESSGRLQLTGREREIMALVASGLQTSDIAARLFLSSETVKTHVHNAMGKLGAHTRAHAVAIALIAGQIPWEL